MRKETKNNLLLSGLLFLILITPVIILVIYQGVSKIESKDTLLVETAKAFLQLIGVAVIGGAIKLLYDDFIEQRRQAEKLREQERDRQVAANDIRKGLLADLIAARTQVEESRFRYRIEEAGEPVKQYKETILSILGARLNLSRIWNAIHTSSYLFIKHERITDNIHEMKVYLDSLIDEYEKEIKKIQETPEEDVVNSLRQLPVFGDFVKSMEQANLTNYGKKFLVHSYRPAVEEIRREVLLARELNTDDSLQSKKSIGNASSNN